MAKTVGVDLGTANTLMCLKGSGIVIRTPSVVAVNRDTREIIAQGAEAKRMMGKTPVGISAFRPVKDGVITDAEVTSGMLKNYFKHIGALSTFSRPYVIASIPYGVTEVEGGGLKTIIKQLGSAGVADPLNQRSSVGWKATKTAEILIDAYMIRCEHKSAFSGDVDAN